MLIYLDPTLITYFEGNGITPIDLEALENIISSHRKGYHYVAANRASLEYLSTIPELSSINKKQLKMLDLDYSTLSTIVERVDTKIIVKPSNASFKRIDKKVPIDILGVKESITSIFEIPLKEFLTSEILDKTRLVSEHIDDCHLYEFISNEFLKIRKLPCKITFDRVHGGGNDTHKLFLEKILDHHIVISIVDSDKNEPLSDIGNTAKQVIDVYNSKSQSSIIGYEMLPVHEKENLFSPLIYEKFGRKTRTYSLEQLKILIEKDVDNSYYPYIDLKEGLHSGNFVPYYERIFEIQELAFNNEGQTEKFENQFIGNKESFLEYCDKQSQLKKSMRKDKYLIEPLGSNPLGDFDLLDIADKLEVELDALHPNTPDRIFNQMEEKLKIARNILNYLLDFQREYFNIFSKNICEWGLSNPKKSAN